MSKILVSGLINTETTLKISGFPIKYSPVNYPFFGVNTTVSGVGVNIAKALSTLGNDINLISIVGRDYQGDNVIKELEKNNIGTEFIRRDIEKTPQSVVIYDEDGKRQIHTDLKDIQEKSYDMTSFEMAINECDIAILCNINFSRPFLSLARKQNKVVATDVHAIENIEDSYNADFMRNANILFMSHEKIKGPVEDFVQRVVDTYNNDIVVVGMGSRGALLYVKEDNFIGILDAVNTRKIVNTVGAGDSLFSCFMHFYSKDRNPYEALRKAIVFASYKIGSTGAAEGFLSEDELNRLYESVYQS